MCGNRYELLPPDQPAIQSTAERLNEQVADNSVYRQNARENAGTSLVAAAASAATLQFPEEGNSAAALERAEFAGRQSSTECWPSSSTRSLEPVRLPARRCR